MRACRLCGVLAIVCAATLVLAAEQSPDPHLPTLMTRIAKRVGEFYARAQSIVCEERVRLQPLRHDLLWTGEHVRDLVYELRIAWEAPMDEDEAPEATVLRELVSVNGRPPRPGDEPQCMDPKPVSTEPLAMLLPKNHGDYRFVSAGPARLSGRTTATLDYRSVSPKSPEVTWKGECVSISLPGRTRGRVSVDPVSADVLRLDEHLTGLVDIPVPRSQMKFGSPASMTIERADSSIRYRAVTFTDPDETVILPESIESLQVVRNSGSPRMRITQTFSKYRRFITGGRILQ